MPDSYAQISARETTLRLRAMYPELPVFCGEFFRGIEPETSALTRLNYAYDFKLFFRFLSSEIPDFNGKAESAFTIDDLELVTLTHLELYLEFLTLYYKDEKEIENHEAGRMRKLSSVRSLFKYFFKKERLTKNIAALIDLPKVHEKPITRLEINEVADLLDIIDSGERLTDRQKKYNQLTRVRDSAILSLLLGTGIRVSECVGLNLTDIDFTTNGFSVTRKGGNRTILYFPDEVGDALRAYIAQRNEVLPLPGHEDALFLSLQKRRIEARSIQNLVKKYSRVAVPLKKISPHKLRSTFGTSLYQETGDIYLVADVLGHSDVNTTRKHYAAMSDSKRRMAAKTVKLRDDKPE